ncbi:NAD(P)-dependent glycerol-3-phosphate dehydrogenase [Mariprofundus erugo]|uniref:Glycerol-3-phosphate dehydrogenase [NAD(P)+] n=1 Tax=Mariprofundus erugo TaxID=2528639 RepID=A0A5R9GSF2_9PROT|nr:NAD(P)H-dependent glycerol-3-phosphate dehydrogenase [Mariprofundus erugo]TLS66982.1 NAD(P)-dependent glycerol-3-phosphate dehydrogenase [Mariprofundus erugo]
MGEQQVVTVWGAGSWGTALALVLARSGRQVRLVARNDVQAELLNSSRENARYLPGIPLPANLHVMADPVVAMQGAAACVYALPCATVDSCLPLLADGDYPVIAACKGLHPQTLERTDQMFARHIAAQRIALLSGPSFAAEVARGQPTAITMAASDLAKAEAAAAFFDDTSFRIYSSDDLIGVAMGGALKNVIAIAAGMADGLGFGHNSVAAAVTRGLSEMARLTVACGGRYETLMGLSGLGDLVLTCTGTLSRNRRFGAEVARGAAAAAAVASIGQVVEGVRTAEAADRLAGHLGIELPLIQTVHRVLSGSVRLPDAVHVLMSRPERAE